ncbi:MAG: translation initiation factor [Rubripirellula sp.]
MTRLFAGTPFDIPPRCDRCNELEADCKCPPAPVDKTMGHVPPEKQTAKVRADRRKHKRMVTIVWGLEPNANDFADLLSQLKSACGCGGCIQDDQIELQGDHIDRVKTRLKEIGYKVK